MDTDDLEPRKTKPQSKDLAPLGVQELTAYIDDLKAEIIRAEAELAKRASQKNAAEAFFRKG